MYSSTIPTANGNAPHTEAHLIRRLFVKACCAHYLVSVYFGSSDCNHSTIRAKQLITGQSFYITTELNLLLILHRGLKTLVSTDKQPSLMGATHARVYCDCTLKWEGVCDKTVQVCDRRCEQV